MSFSQFTKPTHPKSDDTIRQKIQYKKISGDDKFGLIMAIIGQGTIGKSLLAGCFGYFNSKFISKLDPEKFPNTIRLMKEGYMPEVERIVVLDLDNKFEKSLSRGEFNRLLNPLLPIEIVKNEDMENLYIPKRQTTWEKGRMKNARPEELFKAKAFVEEAIQTAVKDYGPETLFIIDSLSSYYEILNDMFSIVYEAAFDAGMFEKVKNQNQWQIRNAWWAETMKKKVNYPGWQIDIVKAVLVPDHWMKAKLAKDPNAIPYNIKWAEGSGDNEFNMDQVYWIKEDADGLKYFDLMDGRYKSQIAMENTKIYYPWFKRNVAFYFIEHMAPYIMAEERPEEEYW
jgi:hypothetical protein